MDISCECVDWKLCRACYWWDMFTFSWAVFAELLSKGITTRAQYDAYMQIVLDGWDHEFDHAGAS